MINRSSNLIVTKKVAVKLSVISRKQLLIFSLCIMSMLLFSGCSAIKRITSFNLNTETDQTQLDEASKLTLPETTYKKDALEITMNNTKTLNPLDPTDYTVDQVLKLIYDPLYAVNQDNSLSKNLVYSDEVIGPTSIRIKLEPNVTFHDGSPLEAKDVIFSFNYIKEHPGSTYDYCIPYIASITQIDDSTLDVVFTGTDRYNLYSLTFPIVSNAYVTSSEYKPLVPIGSGMYSCTRFQSMIDAELTVNPNYHRQLPTIEHVSVTITRKFEDGYNMFNAKRIDVFSPMQTNWHDYSNDTNLQIRTFDSPYFYYIGINLQNYMLREEDGRRLIATVIPYDKIKKEAFLGHFNFTTLPMLPVLQSVQQLDPYYSKNDENSYYMREYNSEKTYSYLKRLREAGFPIVEQVPLTFELIYNSDEMYQEYIAQQIESANLISSVTIHCVGLETQAYYDALKNSKYDLFLNTLKVSVIPDLASFYRTGGADNISRYSNVNLDGLLSSYRLVDNDAGFIKQIENISQVAADKLPIIPLGFLENGYFAHDQVSIIEATHYFNLYQNIVNMNIN